MKVKSIPLSALIPCLLVGDLIIAGIAMNIPTISTDTTSAIDDAINITVDSSCTMGQTVTSSHTTELNPGETNTTIGESRIAAYCNDNEGYAIYAIGYTNGEYGNTNLVSTDGNHTIPTGTSGSNSYWNMKLTQGTATGTTSYLPTMVNEFTTSATIPNDYTKVAYRDSSTISQNQDPTETGSYFTTTYAAHVSTTQSSGIYTGQVQYVMVHPSNAPAPEIPVYMQDVATIKSKLVNYGDTMRAIDSRDGKKYWITKLADGNIWMTQNLDLDIIAGKSYESTDTDVPYTWRPSASTSTTPDWDSTASTPSSYDPGDLYWNGILGNAGDDISDVTVTAPSATPGGTHYHMGNYYNWTAAVATNDSSNGSGTNRSICPAGWKLPTYDGDGSFFNLATAQNLTAGVDGNVQESPAYFVYSGSWTGHHYAAGKSGVYWTGIAKSPYFSYVLDFYYFYSTAEGFDPQGMGSRDNGFSIRCVAR